MASSPPDIDNLAYDSDTDEESLLISGQDTDHTNPSDAPDLSSGLVELGAHEFASYFSERGGRLFHSHASSPYPLPADTPEQQRLNVTHIALNRLIGAYYVGPVSDVLAETPGRQKLVVDLCTGTGKWVIDMANEFPHALFRGIDIVPIATRYPPPNAQFEVHDVNTTHRWRTASVDLVHARSISMAVHSYPDVLREVGRILQPGGLFISCEWGRYPAFHPAFNSSPQAHAPGATRFFEVLTEALETSRGIHPLAEHIPAFLEESGLFTNITPERFYMPIGPWHSDPEMRFLGKGFRAVHKRYADSVRPLLLEAGWTEDEVSQIIQAYIQELSNVHGMVSVLYTVHARKL